MGEGVRQMMRRAFGSSLRSWKFLILVMSATVPPDGWAERTSSCCAYSCSGRMCHAYSVWLSHVFSENAVTCFSAHAVNP